MFLLSVVFTFCHLRIVLVVYETPLMRERLLRKLWFLFEINVKVEILRYWWIEEKNSSVSKTLLRIPECGFSPLIRKGRVVLNSTTSLFDKKIYLKQLSGQKITLFKRSIGPYNVIRTFKCEEQAILSDPFRQEDCIQI